MFRLGQAYIFGAVAGVVTYATLAVVIGGSAKDGSITSVIASVCGFVVGGGVAYWVYTGNK